MSGQCAAGTKLPKTGPCPKCGARNNEPCPQAHRIALEEREALIRALRNCRDRLKMDLEEVKHLRGWLSKSELAGRADQDEVADEADEQAIAAADALLAVVGTAHE